jgi:NAD(P)-dependent dehydrogenase (short-subunit alcohol dehydrogenase family)
MSDFTIAAPNWPAAGVAALVALVFAVSLRRYLRDRDVWRYDTKAAWLRAWTYFAAAWAIAFASGTISTIAANPLVLPGQTSNWLWWVTGLAALGIVAFGYGYIWPTGTRPHGRRIVWPDTFVFGLAWGVSEGLLFGSVWLLAKRGYETWLGVGGLADALTLATLVIVLSAFVGLWHALYWDIHISPEHNIAEWNSRKVLFAHTPNLVVSGIWVTAYENLALYVGLQALALLLSTMAMPFPTFRRPHPVDPDGPALGEPAPLGDLTGQTVVITGAANGIGAETARALAGLGAQIVIVDRDAANGQSVAAELGGQLLVCDLTRPEQVRETADRLLAICPRINVLINNAGVFRARYEETPEGRESTLASNHLGGFLLTALLADRLRESSARVIFVSSDAHRQAGAPDFDNLNGPTGWPAKQVDLNAGFAAYNQSKLLVTAAALELAQRWADSGVTVNVVAPGALVPTNIYAEVTGPFAWFVALMRPLLRTPTEAAQTAIYLAASPEVAGVTGWYWKDRRPTQPSQISSAQPLRREVFERTARMVQAPST